MSEARTCESRHEAFPHRGAFIREEILDEPGRARLPVRQRGGAGCPPCHPVRSGERQRRPVAGNGAKDREGVWRGYANAAGYAGII